jgi:phospholipase/lecithinase/hemolysin
MKTLKRMMVALLALLPMATGMALAEPDHGYDRIFIFGASFMDSGNNFAVTGESAHPPFDPMAFTSYNIGGHRPSNGHTWVEILAREMNLANWAKPAYRDPKFGNYAYAYGRAREVEPEALEQSLFDQVQAWKDNGYCTNNPMTDTLFIVDSAYADLFDIKYAADMDDMGLAMAIMGEVADSIEANIRDLYACGARNLLFVGLPPVEYAPVANQGLPPEDVATDLSEAFIGTVNLALFHEDHNPLPADMNISTVDFFDIFEDLMAMREELGFTNVINTCITYYVTKGAICKNRDEYFWWDMVHPTKKVHALLGRIALMHLPELD